MKQINRILMRVFARKARRARVMHIQSEFKFVRPESSL